jgi:hypothetical protein
MKARRFGIALLLITAVLAPVAPAPALAAPVDGRHFKQGYQDGFERGWKAARSDCAKPARAETFEVNDYTRGFAVGFDRGFTTGAEEYCRI